MRSGSRVVVSGLLSLVAVCQADPPPTVEPTSSLAASLVPPPTPEFTDIVVGTNYGCVLRSDGVVLCWGQDPTHLSKPPATWSEVFEIDSLSDVTHIDASQYLFCAVSASDTVSCWSTREASPHRHTHVFGEIPIVELAIGDDVCVRSTAGEVKCWSHESDSEQLVFSRAIDIEVGPSDGCALDASGEIWCWDLHIRPGEQLAAYHLMSIEGATSLLVSDYLVCARRQTGEVRCRDRIGPGNWLTPEMLDSGELRSVALAEDHVCYVVTDGTVSCQGNNAWAQLGAGTTTRTNEVVTIKEVTGADAIAASAFLSCALTRDAALCWGTRGRGWSDPPIIERNVVVRDATSLVVDADFACATRTASEPLCWGSFHMLDFDPEGLVRAATPTPTGVELGQLAKVQGRCLLDRGGDLRCWTFEGMGCAVNRGTAGCGPLDIDARHTHISDFVRGKINCLIRKRKLECTDPFRGNERLAIPALRDVTRVHMSLHSSRVCVVHAGGRVSCFGMSRSSYNDPVIIEDATRIPELSQVASLFEGPNSRDCAITTHGQVWCWAELDTPTRVDLPAGDQGAHYREATCVRTLDGEVACRDELGELTWLDIHGVAELRGGSRHICALDQQGVVTCIGDGGAGQLGKPPAGLMLAPVRVDFEAARSLR